MRFVAAPFTGIFQLFWVSSNLFQVFLLLHFQIKHIVFLCVFLLFFPLILYTEFYTFRYFFFDGTTMDFFLLGLIWYFAMTKVQNKFDPSVLVNHSVKFRTLYSDLICICRRRRRLFVLFFPLLFCRQRQSNHLIAHYTINRVCTVHSNLYNCRVHRTPCVKEVSIVYIMQGASTRCGTHK